jgi:lysophospholipase L1-like esterase
MNHTLVRNLIPSRQPRGMGFVLLVLLLLVATALTAGSVPSVRPASPPSHWIGTWSTSPMPPDLTGISTTGLDNQTVRLIVHTSIAGTTLRLRLANTFGTAPLTIGQVDVADQLQGASIVSGSGHQLTFGGSPSVTIPTGAEVFSDPLAFQVQAQQNVAVSLYVPQPTGATTWHALSWQTSYISQAGNHAADQQATAFTTAVTSWFWLDGVDVIASNKVNAIVTLGDSITEGFNSTTDANDRWPDVLARRLLALPRPQQEAVLNEGISGNRVLNNAPCCGINALARLDRDVLAQDGVRFVIYLEGINDIGFSLLTGPETAPQTDVSADQIIAGIQQIIARVHARGLKIYGGTLTPFQGAFYSSTAGEAKREAVNQWIRTSGAFDAVIDFDKVVRDPQNPLRILAAYDSGDHLHPNDAGYAAMANAINLHLFKP